MKKNECFDCLNHTKSAAGESNGWYHPCKFEINNEGYTEKDLKKCPKFQPNKGFQIGGYYTHMHFEPFVADQADECLEWFIHGDGEFPRNDNPEEWIQFHICDFKQIEEWVKFWGKELRKRGLVS